MSQQGPVIFNGRYELHQRLGRGGMAEVYLARDQMLDRPVAVKVLFPALATDPGFVERFRREAQRAAGLNHPNIVGVYDWGEANGTYFIVMEYVEGESLAEQIHREGRLHPDRAAEIAADTAAALGFAHSNGGVIHRDVKPGNVLITREGGVKVADFGIARAISDSSDANLTKTGSVMGTATYFSPEQARGVAIDPRSDVYSLGCVLYEMITGHPPFSGENAVAIAYKHVQEAPVAPRRIDPALPETLEAIILKCLAKNPANRYPSAQDMRADLKRYLEGARIMAEPVLTPPVDPGATGLMAPTGYMAQTSTIAPTGRWDRGGGYGDDGYRDRYEDYDDYEDEEPKRPKAFLAVLALLAIVLAGVLFLLVRSLNDNGDGAVKVKVPAVVGLQRVEAQNALEAKGFDVKVTEEPNDREIGIVFKQDPGANDEADEGSQVEIFVSAGAETFPVPNVVGKTQDEARQILETAGYLVNPVEVPDDTVPVGSVVSQDPAANAPLAKGQQVTINISSGPNAVPIPSVVGKTQAQATTELQGAGFKVEVQEEPSDTVPDGSVIKQDRTGSAARGETITITVSLGPGEVPVPDVRGLSEQAAKAQLTSAGLAVGTITYQDTNDPTKRDQVISQVPSNGTSAPKGTAVSLVITRFNPLPGSTTTSTEP
ncbi:MAG TPA: Stk1 family PASTA domain-containing Ser/Thr kinase [Acidimicrobiales bacterium]